MGACASNSKAKNEGGENSSPFRGKKKNSDGPVNLSKSKSSDAVLQNNGSKDASSVKKHLQESRKLKVNYTMIPNRIHKQQTILPEDEASGLIGLTNLGNTCFFNSALQCLLNTPPIADYFMNDLHLAEVNEKNPLGSKGVVTMSFADLCKLYWSREDIGVINPKEFRKVIGEYASQFAQGTQEDCHEFLTYLLDIVHEDLNRVIKKPYVEDKEYDDAHLEEDASESWKNYLLRNKSVVVDLFQGQSKSTLKCLKCGYLSHRFEPFMYLSLPIPQGVKDSETVTLTDCLKEYTKEEKLEGDERWHCPKCGIKVDSTKKIDIWKLPNILIVHLKRFEFTPQRSRKIRALVDFPYQGLDLEHITAGVQRDKPIYDLYAVANHDGSLGGGHYYTFAKNRDDKLWYAYNDAEVFTLNTDQIVSPSAYLMFFSKTSVTSFKRQTISRPEAWPHLMSQSTPAKGKVSEEDKQVAQRNQAQKRMSLSKPFELTAIQEKVAKYVNDVKV